jgi:hypothetical protein
MNKDDITIVIASSVLPSHPDTRIIDETINSVRHYFPNNEIILQIDGLRNERIDRKADYDEYKNKMLWKALHEDKNILPIIFEEHSHQTTMMFKTIDMIKTPLILYVEGDAPITTDLDIDWDKCVKFIEDGYANTIRFHFEASIPIEHNHLMYGLENGFMKTTQWSQRPHLSTVYYYKNRVLPNVPEKSFIEDTLHGYIQEDCKIHGEDGFQKHKLFIYHPEGNIKRSYHTDGREGTRKFTSDDDVWGYTE